MEACPAHNRKDVRSKLTAAILENHQKKKPSVAQLVERSTVVVIDIDWSQVQIPSDGKKGLLAQLVRTCGC